MPPALEMLAQQLAHSGRLRINADRERNFITYSGPGFDTSFSKREMTDPNLLPETKQAIARTLPSAVGSKGLSETYERLLQQFRRTGEIVPETEIKLARLITQATHPAIVLLCLIERVDIFISYSHNVADLMAMHFWQGNGLNSGMQSLSGDGTAVYVSCGGDPFIIDDAHKTYTTDGFPALARLMVIAAQEFAHFADLKRDAAGHAVGRHSAHLSPLTATNIIHTARQHDMQRTAHWQKVAYEWRIGTLAKQEEQRKFYRTNRRFSPTRLWHEIRCLELQWTIRYYAMRRHVGFITTFPKRTHGLAGYATRMMECLRDMAFNLAPDADAYRRDNAAEENAIACIEALARVPQQVTKWGHATTRICWPKLYAYYYEIVIPATIKAYEVRSGKRYHFPQGDTKSA